jgi:futalosine hydrolase
MKILIVAATIAEIKLLKNYLDDTFSSNGEGFYQIDLHSSIQILITGVGVMHTAFALSHKASLQSFDLAINLGVCGSFDLKIALGSVIEVVKDRLGDLGVEEANGQFLDVFDINLENKDSSPYQNGWISRIENNYLPTGLPPSNGITVHKVTGTTESIEAIQKKYNADMESMEGAAFFYTCAKLNIPSIQVRAISNYVEPRNRAAWKMEEAIHNLNLFAIEYLKNLTL